MPDKIPNNVLKQCAVKLMADCGRPMERVPTRGRSMIYKLLSGQTVRIRTSNDPVLVAVAELAGDGVKLNVEGTDFLLMVMPIAPRKWGEVCAYLVPTDVVLAAINATHFDLNPKEENPDITSKALVIWFENNGRPNGGFGEKWRQYRLEHLIDARQFRDASPKIQKKQQLTPKSRKESTTLVPPGADSISVSDVIADAREKISEITGLPLKLVKIEVRLGD